MNNTAIRAAIIFAILLTALHIISAFVPNIFTWGFHFLGFLPKGILLTYFILAVLGIAYIARGHIESLIQRLANFMSRKPIVVLAITIGIFAFFAVAFRVQVPLLGDSFIAVKIFSKTIQGAQVLGPSHQPLALYYFYLFLKLLGTFNYPEMMNAFLAGELLLGIGFIIVVFFTMRNLFENTVYQCLSFLFLLVLPYMQLFFGYVELYAVILFLLSAYMLVSVLYLRGKIHFAVVPLVFTLLVLSHYLNALLLPSLLYLAVLEYKRGRLKHLAISAGVLAGCALIGLAMMNFSIEKFIPPNRGTPILTIASSDNIFQAYTLFSPYHFSDLINLALFLCPSALFLIGMTFRWSRSELLKSSVTRFLSIASVPIVTFIVMARFDIPMAQDWDVPASYSYLLTLYGLVVAEGWMSKQQTKIFSVIILIIVLNSLTWWYLNSTVDPNIQRLKQFIDKRISSHDGIYQSMYHLGEHFIRAHDTNNVIEISEQFISMYPADKRGYLNYIPYLQQFGRPMDEKITGIFERWLAIDSTNPDAREQYANFHLDVGNRSYREELYEEAIDHFKKAMSLAPNVPDVYNGLGIAYRKIGDNDRALFYYLQTLKFDSTNVYASINLGNLYDDIGNAEQAITWYKKALTIQPNSPQLHYNLGITYYKRGDAANAMGSLRQAARLGDADAQAFLRERGEQW